MFLTFAELERRAYINGRTFLAKAYAAADDATGATQDALDRVKFDDDTKLRISDASEAADKKAADTLLALKSATESYERAITETLSELRSTVEVLSEEVKDAATVANSAVDSLRDQLQLGLEV